ncbi:MAG TPA: glycosyltransferase [Acidimicrobiales bacterium]|nr:glycosyltransferase [Acidimicrobiales bacterium]
MAVTPNHVVFVTRDGTLGGDQLFLLYFLRWLTASTTVRAEVLTWHEGTLTDDLRDVTDVRSMDELDRWRPARVFEVLRVQRAAQVLKGARLRWWLHRRRGADVLYVNGLEAARIVGYLRNDHPRVVVHVHDLGDLEGGRLTDVDRDLVRERTDTFVAASDEVADALRAWGVTPDRIRRHDHFVTGAGLLPASTRKPDRVQLGLAEDDLVVGGIGTADWWAAADQFVLLAWTLRRRRPDLPLRFLWIAGDDDERILWPLRHDLANAGVDDVTVVATGRRSLDHLDVLDVLALSTRVESQELIALEAAAADVPVVATDNLARTGSIGELAHVVPYLDVDAMAAAVDDLLLPGPVREAQVERGREVTRRHHDVSVGGPALLDLLGSRR